MTEDTDPFEIEQAMASPSQDEASESNEVVLRAILPSARCVISQSSSNHVEIHIDGDDFLPETNIVGGTDFGFDEDHGMSTKEVLMFADFDQLNSSSVKIHIESNNHDENTVPIGVQSVDFDMFPPKTTVLPEEHSS